MGNSCTNSAASVEQEDWSLKYEAERIFKLADKDGSGFIDMKELANVRNSEEFAKTMMDAQDLNGDGKLNLQEWLTYIKGIFDKKESSCSALLKLYEKNIEQNNWSLKAEAERIFKLADKDGSGFIDMRELANVRNSEEFAKTMMDAQDLNGDGKLNLQEWLAYIKGIYDKKESSCSALLKLYEKNIGQN